MLPALFGAGCDGELSPNEVLERVSAALVETFRRSPRRSAILLGQGISTGLEYESAQPSAAER